MTAAAQKLSVFAIAMALCLGLTALPAHAQNEPEAASTQLEQPQAAPTEFSPVTAGDAARGASAAGAEASPTAAAQATPESAAASPDAMPSTSAQMKAPEAASGDNAAKSPKKADSKKASGGNTSGPAAIVPENSP